MTSLNDFITSQIRTWVPLLVAFIVNILGTNGVIIPEEASAGLTAFLSALAGGVWYLVARILETKFGAKWGLLLGVPKQPEYAKPL